MTVRSGKNRSSAAQNSQDGGGVGVRMTDAVVARPAAAVKIPTRRGE